MESGFNAFGKPVPSHRLTNGYDTVKEMIQGISTEKAFSIVGMVARAIEKDKPYEVVGNPNPTDDLGLIDLTGRYKLLSVMLTG